MDIDSIPGFIRERVINGQYQIKLHALQRINERGVVPSEIRDALLECTIVENYPDDKRGHSCLVWGKSGDGRDLHLVCGFAGETVWVITIYEPDPEKWETPMKRRVAQ